MWNELGNNVTFFSFNIQLGKKWFSKSNKTILEKNMLKLQKRETKKK